LHYDTTLAQAENIMLMNDVEILKALDSKHLAITPFQAHKLKGASYDLSLGREALVSNRDEKVLLGSDRTGSLNLEAGDFALVLTKESLKFPLNMAAVIGMRSTLARMGLILLHGMQVDPGFEGHLRFGLYNASPRKVTLDYEDDICMIEFHKLSGNATKPPPRNEDLIQGRIPESDRQFLRSLETTSLSEVAQNLRTMSQSVDTLSKEMTTFATVQNRFIIPGILAILIGVIIAIITTLIKK
jgi:deoxycytidine triphosphate deaminase